MKIKNVVIVGMINNNDENKNKFIFNVFSSCYGSKYIQYIKEHKMIEFKETISIFDGKIIDVTTNTIIVEVLKDSNSFKEGEKVRINTSNASYIKNQKIRITFNGMINDSNPPQISPYNIELIK